MLPEILSALRKCKVMSASHVQHLVKPTGRLVEHVCRYGLNIGFNLWNKQVFNAFPFPWTVSAVPESCLFAAESKAGGGGEGSFRGEDVAEMEELREMGWEGVRKTSAPGSGGADAGAQGRGVGGMLWGGGVYELHLCCCLGGLLKPVGALVGMGRGAHLSGVCDCVEEEDEG